MDGAAATAQILLRELECGEADAAACEPQHADVAAELVSAAVGGGPTSEEETREAQNRGFNLDQDDHTRGEVSGSGRGRRYL